MCATWAPITLDAVEEWRRRGAMAAGGGVYVTLPRRAGPLQLPARRRAAPPLAVRSFPFMGSRIYQIRA